MADYSPLNILRAFLKETVYQKLSGAEQDRRGLIWLDIMSVIRHIDPQEFNNSKYSKYVLALHLSESLRLLEDRSLISSRKSALAINYDVVVFMTSNPEDVVDRYLSEHLKGSGYD